MKISQVIMAAPPFNELSIGGGSDPDSLQGALEYNPTEAQAVDGMVTTFDSTAPTLLRDADLGSQYWLDRIVTSINTVLGYGHKGESALTQTEADARVAKIQIWVWVDSNGDGVADQHDAAVPGQRTTRWFKVYEVTLSAAVGHVIGYNVTGMYPTSTWLQNILQGGAAIPVSRGNSYLFLIRVVDIAGNSNLTNVPGVEKWDDGDTSDTGTGSDIPGDKYMDANGNTPGTSDGRVPDKAVVWVYVKR